MGHGNATRITWNVAINRAGSDFPGFGDAKLLYHCVALRAGESDETAARCPLPPGLRGDFLLVRAFSARGDIGKLRVTRGDWVEVSRDVARIWRILPVNLCDGLLLLVEF